MTWPVVPLSSVATVQGGKTPKGLNGYLADNPRDGRDIPFYKVGDMKFGPTLRTARTLLCAADLPNMGLAALPIGTLVFPKAGGAIATNKKRTIEVPGAIDLNCMAVIPGPDLHERYLRLWFESFDLSSIADGSVLPQISKRNASNLQIPLPPLLQQRHIVGILEDHLSRLDSAESGVLAAERKFEALWLSCLSAVRQNLAGSPRRSIGAIAMTSLGKMLDAKKQTGSATPYLRNINVRWGFFDLKDVQRTLLTPEDIERFDIGAGDLLVCEGGEPGRCAVWREPVEGVAFQKALHRIRISSEDEVLPEFLCLMLTEAIRSGRCDRLFTGTTIKHLPQEKLRTIEIPVPPLSEQRTALAMTAEVAEARQRISVATDAARRRSTALRKSLLAAAFSGRLTGSATKLSTAEEMIGA